HNTIAASMTAHYFEYILSGSSSQNTIRALPYLKKSDSLIFKTISVNVLLYNSNKFEFDTWLLKKLGFNCSNCDADCPSPCLITFANNRNSSISDHIVSVSKL